MSDKTITLQNPVDWHGKSVTQITIREPRGAEHRRIGQPQTMVFSKDGMAYFVEQPEAIAAYADACLTHEGGKVLLNMLSLADSIAVNKAIVGFFTDAERAILN